jgi:hypothetical protein
MTDDQELRVVGDALCDWVGRCTCTKRSGRGDTHSPDCGWEPIADVDAVRTALAEFDRSHTQ